VNRTVSFENELVPLDGRIGKSLLIRISCRVFTSCNWRTADKFSHHLCTALLSYASIISPSFTRRCQRNTIEHQTLNHQPHTPQQTFSNLPSLLTLGWCPETFVISVTVEELCVLTHKQTDIQCHNRHYWKQYYATLRGWQQLVCSCRKRIK